MGSTCSFDCCEETNSRSLKIDVDIEKRKRSSAFGSVSDSVEEKCQVVDEDLEFESSTREEDESGSESLLTEDDSDSLDISFSDEGADNFLEVVSMQTRMMSARDIVRKKTIRTLKLDAVCVLPTMAQLDEGILQQGFEEAEDSDGTATVFPPLTQATLELKLKVVTLNEENARRSTSLLKKVSTPTGKKQKRTGVYVESVHSIAGHKKDKKKSAKCSSREYDRNVIDIGEVLSFKLQTTFEEEGEGKDEGKEDVVVYEALATDGVKKEEEERVRGSIDLGVWQSAGYLKRKKALGFADIKTHNEISAGNIDRSGIWAVSKLPLFDISSADFKAKKARLKKKRKMVDARECVGTLEVEWRLHWTSKHLTAFMQRKTVRSRVLEPLMMKTSIGALSPMQIMRKRNTRMKLSVLGVGFGNDAFEVFAKMDHVKVSEEMAMLSAHSSHFEDVHTGVRVQLVFRCEGAEVKMLSKEHSSKAQDSVYIGEEFDFDIPPFDVRPLSALGNEGHPQLEFFKGKTTTQSPGAVLLTVRKKRQVIGCALVHVSFLVEAATMAPAEIRTDTRMFVEPMFGALTKKEWKRGKEDAMNCIGSVFVKQHFDWI